MESNEHAEKHALCRQVWAELERVAIPDAQHGRDFSAFIPDFAGSDQAADRLAAHPSFQQADLLLITPDACLGAIAGAALREGKTLLMTSGGLRKGFLHLSKDAVPHEILQSDAVAPRELRRHAQTRALEALRRLGRVDLLITGAAVVNLAGQRLGKGHGYFDLEWAILWTLGLVGPTTPVAALVHDIQVVLAPLPQEPFDVGVDLIVTPTQLIEATEPHKPTGGIDWPRLTPEMRAEIPLLAELG